MINNLNERNKKYDKYFGLLLLVLIAATLSALLLHN